MLLEVCKALYRCVLYDADLFTKYYFFASILLPILVVEAVVKILDVLLVDQVDEGVAHITIIL